jgi:hypothetical protein
MIVPTTACAGMKLQTFDLSVEFPRKPFGEAVGEV